MHRGARGRFPIARAAGALACLLAMSLATPAPVQAAKVTLPLRVPFDVLLERLTSDLYSAPGGVAQLWQETPCRHLTLDHPAFDRRGPYLRFVTHGDGVAGTRFLWFCLNALRWRGYVEALTTPYVTLDWQLRLRVADSGLYDERWREGRIRGLLWDVMQRLLLPRLTGLSVDLTPPRDELIGLVRTVVGPGDAARMESVLRGATVERVEVGDDAVVAHLVLEMPDAFVRARPPAPAAEAPLSPAELEAVERALERWDAFLVFVVKNLGLDIADPGVRAELLGLLIESRYQLLPVLTGPVRRSAGDPVRRLFVQAWTRLHEILATADKRGLLGDRARFARFIAAGDALAALDRAAPGLGIEISADGLRRLARLLAPSAAEDPLRYSDDVDPGLRALFGLPPETDLPPAPASPPGPTAPPSPGRGSGLSWRLVVYTAVDEAGDELSRLNQRLARWVPTEGELPDFQATMGRLLELTGDGVLRRVDLEARYAGPFRTLVPATALQESCWQQFERKEDTITYRASPQGSVGLMQVNRRVWRGFYHVERLQWDTAYNARAGAEILLLYLRQYGIREGRRTGRLGDAIRSTWAVYNGGPAALGRYRDPDSTARERRVDEAFWERYSGLAAGGTADVATCATRPPARPRAALGRARSPQASPQSSRSRLSTARASK
ncbi:MAG TPA: lytic transglycosylase domain-containing protein [Methylomirabilota bacterium]|nr:lytic transglycosylase domain-containing protein [Methylomirabilota bacterium]